MVDSDVEMAVSPGSDENDIRHSHPLSESTYSMMSEMSSSVNKHLTDPNPGNPSASLEQNPRSISPQSEASSIVPNSESDYDNYEPSDGEMEAEEDNTLPAVNLPSLASDENVTLKGGVLPGYDAPIESLFDTHQSPLPTVSNKQQEDDFNRQQEEHKLRAEEAEQRRVQLENQRRLLAQMQQPTVATQNGTSFLDNLPQEMRENFNTIKTMGLNVDDDTIAAQLYEYNNNTMEALNAILASDP
eukprot:TRINITY_DN191_c0_g1_i1.p1 TRINITY_DN191_c0_g1~~TRINITY_DN191_c0_g1_i1.p1  ORF type:complete len:244 (-),score=64.66 TRINITY_DN191_c0_g1_i1:55-786(-)